MTENIRPATQYTFRVYAYDDAGRSSASTAITVVTPISDSSADTTPPQAPSGLTITGESPAGAALSWSPSTDDVAVTGYNVYWFDGVFVSRLVATVSGTSYIAALPAERNVFYVRARDAAGNVSIASNTVNVYNSNPPSSGPPSSPPPPPPACRVSYQHTAQWSGGFVASLTITNTGTVPVDGWTLAFALGGFQWRTGVHRQARQATENTDAIVLMHDHVAGLPIGEGALWGGPARTPGHPRLRSHIAEDFGVGNQREIRDWRLSACLHQPTLNLQSQIPILSPPTSRRENKPLRQSTSYER